MPILATNETGIVNFGQNVSGPLDECFYDPLGMRAYSESNFWVAFGAPSNMRTLTDKFVINIKCFVQGTWGGTNSNNYLIIFADHYRNGVPTGIGGPYQLAQNYITTANGNAFSFNCERTILGFTIGEHFIASTDYYSTTDTLTISMLNTECEFILAQ